MQWGNLCSQVMFKSFIYSTRENIQKYPPSGQLRYFLRSGETKLGVGQGRKPVPLQLCN